MESKKLSIIYRTEPRQHHKWFVPSTKSSHDQGSQMLHPGRQANVHSQINASGSQINARGSQINARGSQINASGSQINAHGGQINANGSLTSVNGRQINDSGDLNHDQQGTTDVKRLPNGTEMGGHNDHHHNTGFTKPVHPRLQDAGAVGTLDISGVTVQMYRQVHFHP